MPKAHFDPNQEYSPEAWYPSEDSSEKAGIVLGRFVERQIVDEQASKEAGEYIYKNVIGCYMRPASSADTSYSQLKHDTAEPLIERFKDAWRAFDKHRAKPEGTTLDGVSFIDRSTKFKLLGIGVETMEQLADLDKERQKKVFGAPALVRQAKSYLSTSKGSKGKDDAKDDMRGCA